MGEKGRSRQARHRHRVRLPSAANPRPIGRLLGGEIVQTLRHRPQRLGSDVFGQDLFLLAPSSWQRASRDPRDQLRSKEVPHKFSTRYAGQDAASRPHEIAIHAVDYSFVTNLPASPADGRRVEANHQLNPHRDLLKPRRLQLLLGNLVLVAGFPGTW